ncbi:MAG: type II toxin-antitoxin system VapC family toxin [Symploca sp. SIO2C1]|nr:type II toxin-antitoxin system VapC family toxin [Symploca sp. SIO2C1]
MIILDTNVISELMREAPNQAVAEWIASHKSFHLALTTISIAEIQRGLARLPKGKRRTELESNFSSFIKQAFSGRIYTFDEDAAYTYGNVSMQRETIGLHADAVDMMIAAIATSQNASIATRNVKDFEECGVHIINPWDYVS